MDTPGHPFSGKLRAVNSNPHAPGADPASPSVAAAPATASDGTAVHGLGDSGPVCDDRARVRELGGREGLEPTRYGDWELRGRCIDF